MRPPRIAFAPTLVLAVAVGGCVVVPTTRETYDPQCKVMKREIQLEVAKAAPMLHSCRGDECAAFLAAAGIVTAASVVVSGSIAVVGNVLFWLERQGKCVGQAPVESAPDPAAAPRLPA
jgi:hypothetical protein